MSDLERTLTSLRELLPEPDEHATEQARAAMRRGLAEPRRASSTRRWWTSSSRRRRRLGGLLAFAALLLTGGALAGVHLSSPSPAGCPFTGVFGVCSSSQNLPGWSPIFVSGVAEPVVARVELTVPPSGEVFWAPVRDGRFAIQTTWSRTPGAPVVPVLVARDALGRQVGRRLEVHVGSPPRGSLQTGMVRVDVPGFTDVVLSGAAGPPIVRVDVEYPDGTVVASTGLGDRGAFVLNVPPPARSQVLPLPSPVVVGRDASGREIARLTAADTEALTDLDQGQGLAAYRLRGCLDAAPRAELPPSVARTVRSCAPMTRADVRTDAALRAPTHSSCRRLVGRGRVPACLVEFARRAAALFGDPHPRRRLVWFIRPEQLGFSSGAGLFVVLLRGDFRGVYGAPRRIRQTLVFINESDDGRLLLRWDTATPSKLRALGTPRRF